MVITPFIRKRDLRCLNEPILSGHTLQLTTGVLYFGLILDKGLMRNVQLKNVMNKAYRAFWTFKGKFVKTWSQKPSVVHRIYTMAIRRILTYGSMVSWLRVTHNISRTELSDLQRLACLATTGAMKMIPAAAMEALLGLFSLHVMIKVEAQVGTYRLIVPSSRDLIH
jgi:hypothetical protein